MAEKCFVLKSTWNKKFLEYEHGIDRNKFSGVLTPSQNVIYPKEFRYQMEMATTGFGLVHIKCFCNQKYLVPQGDWITSTADEPGEDTLFQIITGSGNTIQLRHVKLNRYACHKPSDYNFQVGWVIPTPYECYNFNIYGTGSILKDGTYTGVNACNFKCETEEEKQIAASDLIKQLAQ